MPRRGSGRARTHRVAEEGRVQRKVYGGRIVINLHVVGARAPGIPPSQRGRPRWTANLEAESGAIRDC